MTQIERQSVPTLRFPGFNKDWELKTLGDFFKFKNGVNADKSAYGSGRKFINVLDIISDLPITHESIIGSVEITDKEFKKNKVVYGDILFQRSSETREEVGQSNVYLDREREATFGGFVIRGRPIADMDPRYFHYLLKTWLVRRDMTSRSGGSTRYNVGQESLSIVPVTLASDLKEQRKIAEFLGAVDERIAQLEQKEGLLADYKRGCMQQLFSQAIRFKDDQGNDFPDWEEVPLHSVMQETKKQSDGTESVYSVSVHKGLVDQVEHLGRSFSATDTGHYNRVEPGDIVYTKSPTGEFPFGIIKQSRLDKSVIVSPLYGVFRPETTWLGYWLHVYFESHVNTGNYLRPIIQKGAKNTINITNKTFLSAKLKVPTHPDEQRKIADFLSAIDTKIDLVAQELEQAKAFKKGLLQQMFV